MSMVEGAWYSMSNLSVVRAESVQETLDLLAESNLQSKVLSGGVSITLQVRNGNLNCDRLIDISKIEELHTIQPVTVKGKPYLQIGAGLSLSHVAKNPQTDTKFPGFVSVVKNSCDPARLNAFTLGGLLAVKRNAGNLFPALAVLDSLVQVKYTTGEKLIPVMEWLKQVEKESAQLITAVLIPDVPQSGWVVKEVKRRQMPGELIVGLVMSAVIQKSGSPSDLRLASVVDQFGVQRWTAIEEKVNQNIAAKESFQTILDEFEIQLQMRWGDELDAQYRRQVLRALISRSLNEILDEKEVQA
jgi:CO/xanthine dehydrogenase FAD-binding subunit